MKQKQPRDLLSAERKRAGLSYDGILSSVFAIVLGLIVGLIILFLCNPAQALPGFATILTGAFTHGAKGIGQVSLLVSPLRRDSSTSGHRDSSSWAASEPST